MAISTKVDGYPTEQASVEAHKDYHVKMAARANNYETPEEHGSGFDNVQKAIDAALANRRHLMLRAGTVYPVYETLNLTGAEGMEIAGQGAILQAAANMDTLLYLNGIAHSMWRNLWLDTAPGVTVDTMLHMTWDGVVARSTTANLFEHVCVRGQYRTGIQIGETGANRQIDGTLFLQSGVYGLWQPGETELWQTGVRIGPGPSSYGNDIDHQFISCDAQRHRQHYVLDRTQRVAINGRASIAETDIWAAMVNPLRIDLRSEGSAQFLSMDWPALTGGMMVDLSGSEFNPIDGQGSTLRADGRYIEVNYGGNIIMDNFRAATSVLDTPLVIYGRGLQRPLHVNGRGVHLGYTTEAQAVDVQMSDGTPTSVKFDGFYGIETAGRLILP